MQHLGTFILSEGKLYQECFPAKELLVPHKAPQSVEEGLDGWAYLLVSPQKELALAYFESGCEIPLVTGLMTHRNYEIHWFDPVSGEWLIDPETVTTNESGGMRLGHFPDSTIFAVRDWCLKIKIH